MVVGHTLRDTLRNSRICRFDFDAEFDFSDEGHNALFLPPLSTFPQKLASGSFVIALDMADGEKRAICFRSQVRPPSSFNLRSDFPSNSQLVQTEEQSLHHNFINISSHLMHEERAWFFKD